MPQRRPPGPATEGANVTRQAILAAASTRFASDGFTATTFRRVAADAGVDASLVMQFFRSKNELFAAVMSVPGEALERFSAAFAGTGDHLGECGVRAPARTSGGPPRPGSGRTLWSSRTPTRGTGGRSRSATATRGRQRCKAHLSLTGRIHTARSLPGRGRLRGRSRIRRAGGASRNA
ncbi:helix-turn-helix domain-containing protein [Streptomyces sp. NPDC047829]|uniref:TetR/AcrR family transcriptional regulator n=1 Tax=Streptomyces sp. NPDC047829 TaxID=3154609 RepID=UPI00340F4517